MVGGELESMKKSSGQVHPRGIVFYPFIHIIAGQRGRKFISKLISAWCQHQNANVIWNRHESELWAPVFAGMTLYCGGLWLYCSSLKGTWRDNKGTWAVSRPIAWRGEKREEHQKVKKETACTETRFSIAGPKSVLCGGTGSQFERWEI